MCWLEALEAPWSPSFASSMFPPETKCVVFSGRMDELRSFAQGCIRVLVGGGPAVAEGTWTLSWSRKLEARLSKDPSYPNVCPDSYAWSQIEVAYAQGFPAWICKDIWVCMAHELPNKCTYHSSMLSFSLSLSFSHFCVYIPLLYQWWGL